MPIIINPAAGTVSVDGVSRSVAFPAEYEGLDKITHDVDTATDMGGMVGNYTRASIIGLSLSLWKAASPTVADVWVLIKAKRALVNASGVFVGGDWFHTDAETLAQYSIMYAAIPVNGLPGTYVFNARWKTMGGAFKPMTANLLKAIVNTGMAVAAKNFANAERHKALLMASPAPSTYDYSAGWTEVHT